MRGKVFCVAMALGMVLGGGVKASAEIYLWTDERGVVHMTNQWATVPESARARVSVRDSAPSASQGRPAPEPAAPPVEPRTGTQPPFPVLPDLTQTPPTTTPSPSVVLYPGESSALIPSSRPFVHRPHKLFPPFPYNVKLDPVDPNFVWVGRSRVPKDTFTFPRVSLDLQAQFRNRIRTLEQRPSTPHAPFPALPARP
jgi:Domain of unknown function (DUF4124)